MRHRLLVSLVLLSLIAPPCDARKSSAARSKSLESSPIKDIAPINPISPIAPIGPISPGLQAGDDRGRTEATAEKQKKKQKLARCAQTIVIDAPQDVVFQTLENFDSYPLMFKRIISCQVTKRDANLVYIETCLKPQLFVKQQVQHTVNDMSAKPNRLNWYQLDGNFNYIEGCWNIKPLSGTRSELTYSIGVDAGPVIPAGIVTWILKGVQKEIVAQVKSFTENEYRQQLKASAQSDVRLSQPHN